MVYRELFASAIIQPCHGRASPQPHELCQNWYEGIRETSPGSQHAFVATFGADGMDDISKEFAEFQRALREDLLLQEAIVKNSVNHGIFVEGWSPTNDRTFCGGLASAYPNSATAESDFSAIGREKNVSRGDLTHFSVEGILHSKQIKDLKALSGNISTVYSGAKLT
jgi:hypothetical protein